MTHFSQLLTANHIHHIVSPAIFAIEHQRKADIDAMEGGFELPTNSNTVTH